MDVVSSPQPCAVGEAEKTQADHNRSYASALIGQKPSYAQAKQNEDAKLELFSVNFDNDHPVIQFSMDDVNSFTREEGLHQAVVTKFSYDKPHVSEVRRVFSSQFEVKGRCNVGQLDYRHLLIRFDLFDDYARFIGKSTGYLKSKGDAYFFRTFPWTFGFNSKQETSLAAVWISMPGLPPNLFAKRALLSIASAVGKPIAVDKATQDRTRPSTARVKVIVNLLDKLPNKIKLLFVESNSDKSVHVEQIITYDNLPSYCDICKHQGHMNKACRLNSGLVVDDLESGSRDIIGKLQGDARDYLNKKRASLRRVVQNNPSVNKEDGANVAAIQQSKSVLKKNPINSLQNNLLS